MVNGREPYPDLDWLCIDILKSLDQHGGTATTTEVRDSTGAEDRFKIHYRVDGTLEPSNFITTHQPEGGPGKTPPKELTITEDGQEVLMVVNEEEEFDRDLAERVENLEGRLDTTQNQIEEINQKLDNLDIDRFMDLAEAVNDLESRVGQMESDPVFEAGIQKRLSVAMAMAGVLKDEWVEKRGKDEVNQLLNGKLEEIPTLDQSE